MADKFLKINSKSNQPAKLWQILELIPVGTKANIDNVLIADIDDDFLTKLSKEQISLNENVSSVSPIRDNYIEIFTEDILGNFPNKK